MSADALWDAFEASWPAAGVEERGGWIIREGKGGGKRVSAATGSGDIEVAETAMQDLGQTPLFALRGEDPLDANLAARGYEIIDPVTIYSAPIEALVRFAPRDERTVYEVWPRLAIMDDLWDEAGIGRDRLAVMDRACHAKTGLLGRVQSRAAAVAFVGVHGSIAFLHALEVSAHARRQGAGRHMMGQAAVWAGQHGAETLNVAVTDANRAGNALYASIGMKPVEKYHYRILPGA